jgi:hypothetical protein
MRSTHGLSNAAFEYPNSKQWKYENNGGHSCSQNWLILLQQVKNIQILRKESLFIVYMMLVPNIELKDLLWNSVVHTHYKHKV